MKSLKVVGTKLLDSSNQEIILRGVSSHGLSWYPEYVNYATMKELKDNWKINVFRLAMYTDEEDGYCVSQKENQKRLLKVIDIGVKAAVDLDLYVIIDWHILRDNNPLMNMKEAKIFFTYVSKKYKNIPNVIYEICNEPNGNTTWSDITKYANEVIPVIRENDANAVIIVGTPFWSQRVDEAAMSPLNFSNLMYALHFYASTHKEDLRQKIVKALDLNLPIFVSEFGLTEASGNGEINFKEVKVWFDFLAKYKLSHISWNLSHRDESSAILVPNCKRLCNWSESDLTTGGKYLKEYFSHLTN